MLRPLLDLDGRCYLATEGGDASPSTGGLQEPCGQDGPLGEPVMLRVEEARCAELVRQIRRLHPQESEVRGEPIGVAMSGGGTRAAAFHCGLLWQLSNAGLMKDVMHLSATSGGGYTAAALMTHIFQLSAEAEEMPSLDMFYKHVTMRTILRMQHNINYLVESTRSRMLRPPRADVIEEVGTSLLPRIFDLPLLIGSLLGSIASPPAMLLAHTVWAWVLQFEKYYGSMLRSWWCCPDRSSWMSQGEMYWLHRQIWLMAFCAVVAIVLHILMNRRKVQQRSPMRYLISRSLWQIMERAVIFFAVVTLTVLFMQTNQAYHWSTAASFGHKASVQTTLVRKLCQRYIVGKSVPDSPAEVGPTCADRVHGDQRWYESSLYLNATWVAANAVMEPGLVKKPGVPQEIGWNDYEGMFAFPRGFGSIANSSLVLLIAGSLLIGSTLLKWIFTLVLPAAYLIFIAEVARWRIFGPITAQSLFGTLAYTPDLATTLLRCCLVGAMLTLPIYDVVLKFAHFYYRRAMKTAFFHNGRNVSAAAIATCPYCPNLLLGACLHDYRPLGEESNFCEFTISSFFLGSSRTGYFFTPSQARLDHLLTVAGAATDATLLTTCDVLLVRFLLALLSLRFGDFLRLQPEGETAVRVGQKIQSRAAKILSKSQRGLDRGKINVDLFKLYISKVHDKHWLVRWMQGLMDRMPAACPFIVANLLILLTSIRYEHQGNCGLYDGLLLGAMVVQAAIVVLSFFAFLRPFQWLMRSPMIQQFQMLAFHRYKAANPPPYVYVSDGGLIEVLGIVPLLRRRLKCIVVSDAAEDPALTMRCLRDAASICRREGLCSFFDPRDPRRDLEFVLQDLPNNSSGAWLHLGIRYEVREDDSSNVPEIGDLFYVRMRKLPGDRAPVRALLTQEELLSEPQPAAVSSQPGAGLRSDLGGTCCPPCERAGLCPGRRFPDFSVPNQFLGPLQFANLCTLGYELSEPLVRKMQQIRS